MPSKLQIGLWNANLELVSRQEAAKHAATAMLLYCLMLDTFGIENQRTIHSDLPNNHKNMVDKQEHHRKSLQ